MNCGAEYLELYSQSKLPLSSLYWRCKKLCSAGAEGSDLSEADLLISCVLCYTMHAATSASVCKCLLYVEEELLGQGY